MKTVLKIVGIIFGVIILAVSCLLGFLSITEYKPQEVIALQVAEGPEKQSVSQGQMLSVMTWNTGYAGLGRNSDFFMDGGKQTFPESKSYVEDNMKAIDSVMTAYSSDVYFLQEVDLNSRRTWYINQVDHYRHGLSKNQAFAYNYKCPFVPFPVPPMGKIESGIVTYTNLNVTEAYREALPVPFLWPIRTANLKRCLLVERMPVEGTDHELVLVNLHLEAFDEGEGKIAQTQKLMSLIELEYRKGNYVIVGGDFNQTFEDAVGKYKDFGDACWQPGLLEKKSLPKGFSFVFDDSSPTCRSLDKPYDGDRENTQFYVIDGFILSDNLKVNLVETIDLNFQNSDHNPVRLQVTLKASGSTN